MEDVKHPLDAGMICTINGNTFFSFTKNTWIGDLGASCHITNDDTGLYNINDINELIQGSSSIMPATKKSKLQVKVRQVNRAEQVHTLWPVKFCPKAGANLLSLMCELLQGNKISTDHLNNIVITTPSGNIILDCWIKTCDSWVAGVDFKQASNNERAVSATALPKKNINNLYIELGHPSEAITQSTDKPFGIQVTGMFKPCEDCALGKATQCALRKRDVPCLQVLG